MYCGSCGISNVDGVRFCVKCGADIVKMTPIPEQDVEKALDSFLPGGKSGPDNNSLKPTRPPANVTSIQKGTIINNSYEIMDQLGFGGMGVVYRAMDIKLKRIVALKLLLPNSQTFDQTLGRFLREAQVIAQLNHFNIVIVFATDNSEYGHYIAMELIEGGSLTDLLKKNGPLTIEQTIPIFKGVCQGLSYAHKKGVVHRDIKPSNILLVHAEQHGDAASTGEWIPKIVDFGLARIVTDSQLSVTGYGLGTPFYMPPEQLMSAKGVDHRADIYALGATIYQTLTGESQSVRESKIPPQMAPILLKMLEENPEDRYFSINDILKDIENINKLTPRPIAIKAEGINPCPGCGFDNQKETRYCAKCGAGLYGSCPKCNKESKIGIDFCGVCGVNIPQFKKILDHLAKAREFEKAGKSSRAVKELEEVLKYEPEHKEAKELLKQSHETLRQLEALKKLVQEQIDKRDYERAQETYQSILKIARDNEEVVKTVAGIPELIRQRNIARQTESIKVFLDQNDFFTASRKAKALLELDPSSGYAKEVIAQINNKQKTADEIAEKAQEALNKKLYAEAIKQAESAFGAMPNFHRAQDIIKKARNTIEEINELTKEAQTDTKTGQYAQSRQKWLKVLRLDPENEAALAGIKLIETETATVKQKAKRKRLIITATIFIVIAIGVSAYGFKIYSENKSHIKNALKAIAGNDYDRAFSEINNCGNFGASPEEKQSLLGRLPALFELSPNKQGYKEYRHKQTGMIFVLIPGGTFDMGSEEEDIPDKPLHQVTLNDFMISKYEVTQGVYKTIMGANPACFDTGNNHPVEQVTWNNCQDFCQKTGLRLPTEAEWEFACRAGAATKFHYGDSPNAEYMWTGEDWKGGHHPVGQKKLNGFGLYDMSGNVWEWCFDYYAADYYKTSPKDNPQGPDAGQERILRGGSWDSKNTACRSSARNWSNPAGLISSNGFRCAQTVK